MARQDRPREETPARTDGWDAQRTVLLTNRFGLHMRPSKHVVELANTFPCDIILAASGQEVDAKSILGLIGLGAECGTDVEVKARGESAAQAVDAIASMLTSLPELHGEPRDGDAPGCTDDGAGTKPGSQGTKRPASRRSRRGR
jgi:phosphotransferase system HPr (HPr) family protein